MILSLRPDRAVGDPGPRTTFSPWDPCRPGPPTSEIGRTPPPNRRKGFTLFELELTPVPYIRHLCSLSPGVSLPRPDSLEPDKDTPLTIVGVLEGRRSGDEGCTAHPDLTFHLSRLPRNLLRRGDTRDTQWMGNLRECTRTTRRF